MDPQLLADMTDSGWAFDEIYPDPSNIDAYVNRIFHVARVTLAGGEDGYVAATWKPLVFSEDDVLLDPRKLWLQAVLVALVASFVMGWVVMTWLTRRIHGLSEAVSDLASGRLDRRVRDTSQDDLGRLGRDFNTMAARLEHLIDDLRGKEQFQRQLVANVSHDLRTPLASVRGYIETLAMGGRDLPDAEYERYLGIITGNLLHLDQLVDHLLQLSRLDSGQARFSFEEFPLPELVEGVLARAAGAARDRTIALSCDCPDDLPMVLADPLQIGQVLQNLVENGVKFGHDGGHVTVVVRDRRDGTVDVAVTDDGIGIAPDVLPHIFDRFYTGDLSRSAKGQSSGLGLAISQKIVEGHGSRIAVESEVGRGSRFAFRLRAASEALRAGQAEG
ncbi:MAG: HAMP domain-containing sensor histidine kinase [Candidatus Krumholzibacteriia bacterium]